MIDISSLDLSFSDGVPAISPDAIGSSKYPISLGTVMGTEIVLGTMYLKVETSEPVIVPYEEKIYIDFKKDFPDLDQPFSISLGLYVFLLVQKFDAKKRFVVAGLFKDKDTGQLDTIIEPGEMIFNEPDSKGYWISDVRVVMTFQEGYTLTYSQPKTVNADNTYTSSISWDEGFSMGGFGATPTGGAEVSTGGSNTTSHSFTDFTLIDQTKENVLKHYWQLNFDPAPGYKGDGKELAPWGGLFGNLELKQPPDSAISDVSLIDQGQWELPHTANNGKLSLRLCVTLRKKASKTEFAHVYFTGDERLFLYFKDFSFTFPTSEGAVTS